MRVCIYMESDKINLIRARLIRALYCNYFRKRGMECADLILEYAYYMYLGFL